MLIRLRHRLRWAYLVPWAVASVMWCRVAAPRKRLADVLRAPTPGASTPGASPPAPIAGAPTAATVAGAVRWATRVPPFRSTCIVRAVVLARMLRRYGYPAQVVIGLDERGRHAAKRFAHAWVECHARSATGAVGATGSAGYTELVRLEV